MVKGFEGRFVKRGDGYYIEGPSEFAEHSPFKRGDKLHVTIKDGRLIMRKAKPGERHHARAL